METHLTVKCSNSAYSGSTCQFSCPVGMSLLGPGDGKDSCKCDNVTNECDWDGTTRFSDCYEEESLFNLTKEGFQIDVCQMALSANEMLLKDICQSKSDLINLKTCFRSLITN